MYLRYLSVTPLMVHDPFWDREPQIENFQSVQRYQCLVYNFDPCATNIGKGMKKIVRYRGAFEVFAIV